MQALKDCGLNREKRFMLEDQPRVKVKGIYQKRITK